MDLYTFFNTFVEAVANDNELDAWANINFERSVKVYAEVDAANDPDEEDDTPYVIFGSPGKLSHQEKRLVEYYMGAFLTINKDGYRLRTEDNVVEALGVKLVSEFIEHIKNAIVAALPANFRCGFTAETDTVTRLPEVCGYLDIDFAQVLVIGEDPMD